MFALEGCLTKKSVKLHKIVAAPAHGCKKSEI